MSAKFLRNYLIQNGNAFKNVGFDYIIRARIISYRQAVSLRTEQNKLRREKEKKNIDRIHTHMRNINAPKHRVYNVTFVATVSGCTFYTYICKMHTAWICFLSFRYAALPSPCSDSIVVHAERLLSWQAALDGHTTHRHTIQWPVAKHSQLIGLTGMKYYLWFKQAFPILLSQIFYCNLTENENEWKFCYIYDIWMVRSTAFDLDINLLSGIIRQNMNKSRDANMSSNE